MKHYFSCFCQNKVSRVRGPTNWTGSCCGISLNTNVDFKLFLLMAATYTRTQWVIRIFRRKFRIEICGCMSLPCGRMFESFSHKFWRSVSSSTADFFKNDESVIKIKENYDTQEKLFSFTLFSKKGILKAIKNF